MTLEEENQKLRAIVSACAAALGNGTVVAPEASVEFMALLPAEFAASIAKQLKGRAESMRAAAAQRCFGRRDTLPMGSDAWLHLGKAGRTIEGIPLEPPHELGPLMQAG